MPDPDDECARCGHARHYHTGGGNCNAPTGTCGDGCCVHTDCDCYDGFKEPDHA